MDRDYTVGEVEISYKAKFKNLHKVVSSANAYAGAYYPHNTGVPAWKHCSTCLEVLQCFPAGTRVSP